MIHITDKQNYDAWLQWEIESGCNLECAYCIADSGVRRISNTYLDLSKKLAKSCKVSTNLVLKKLISELSTKRPEEMFNWVKAGKRQRVREKLITRYTIDIPALITSLDRAKRIFRVGFSKGEPFLILNLIEACARITEKHSVSFNTNLVSGDIKRFSKEVNPGRVVCIYASLHIKELERLGLTDKYIDNYLTLKEKGFSIYAQEVGYPPLAQEAKKYRRFFRDKGVEISFGIFAGSYNYRNYPESYTDKELRQFGFDDSCRNYCSTFGKTCNAGYNIGIVTENGDISTCYFLGTKLNNSNIYNKITFNHHMMTCPAKFCACPFFLNDPYLFKKAKSELKQK